MRTAALFGLAIAGVALTVVAAVSVQSELAFMPAEGEPDLGPVLADAVWIAWISRTPSSRGSSTCSSRAAATIRKPMA